MNSIGKGLFWKLLERFGVSGIQFVLQIILARLLSPEHYGALSIMVIFTNIANIFVQSGFNTALIQTKNVDEDDYSSVFWVSLGISLILYVVIFFAAPWIGKFYKMPDIVNPMRVLALMLIPGALNSVQIAKVRREMDFKKVFYSSIGGALASGVISIAIALMDGGLWALVAQSLINVVTICIVMRFTVRLKIRFVCNWSRVKVLFSFGWKLLVSSLLDTLYADLRSLVIGKKYDTGTLGYYNRGKQFPQYVINAINGAVTSVMLPAMSERQDNRNSLKNLMRTSISMSAYIIFPMMAGLAAVAEPVVELLLTDKWLPSVPYMQIYCVALAFTPVHSCNLQAINAMGRSDIFLKLEIAKKIVGIAMLVIAVFCFDSPIAIAMTGIVGIWTGWFINAYPNKKLVSYSYFEQIKDILPYFLMSTVMCAVVLIVGMLDFPTIVLLIVQVLIGVIVYFVLSVIIRPEAYLIALQILKKILKKVS